ncbi:bromodomain adjacent to zinc finger domain protein 2B-like isoform X5 [Homarus americanus]|uniref:bromodomain adjacent to zinc finger domain protein 2B-like isoform X5 n=1 Tax=Homarus americanus TaxID=6706 RepID=UPI001C45E031|nr:bromodomain adjacent to zinc finger domain protein 2B-like isoform X5 [Homarus americanus]
MRRMDKSREGERGEKSRGGLPPGMDPATAALYAPWLHQEQALLSNMFGGSGALGAYGAAAAAGLSGWGGLPHGYPPTSTAAGLVSLAAAQQAQQAAALASLGPAAAAYQDRAMGDQHNRYNQSGLRSGAAVHSYDRNFSDSTAAWWNIAGLQQMELLSRLQGGLGGSSGQAGAAAAVAAATGGLGGYGGLHPEHLMNLEILQAQHAAAMAAALSTSKSSSSSSKASKSSKSVSSSSNSCSSSNSKGITSTLSYRGSAATTTTTYSSRGHEPSSNSSRSSLEISRLASSSHSSSSNTSRPSNYPYSTSSSHRYSSPLSVLESVSSHHSELGSSPSLSYGIASLIADKHPSSHHKSHSSSSSANSSSTQAERVAEKLASNGSVSISKAIRNKELEIIPISPAVKGSSQSHGSTPPHRDKSEPKVSISTVGSGNSRLSNGVPSSGSWREECASVSIEPCGSGTPTSTDDAPLNLSMKAPLSSKSSSKGADKRELKESHTSPLSLSRSGVPPFDFSQNLSGGLGSGLPPSLEVLQSLYGQPGEPRDVLASMQEALQRQLLGADGKREEKKKRRDKTHEQCIYQMEDAQERARHLGRGVSKPKKNTVASLLEQCRAAGIKPSSLPLPPTTSIAATPVTTSPPLLVASSRSGESLSITSTSPTFNSSSSPSPASQSLPPTLIPGLPANLPSSLSASIGSPAPPPPIPTPPVPSLSISAVASSPPASSEPSTTTISLSTTSTSSVTSTPMTTSSCTSSSTSPPSTPSTQPLVTITSSASTSLPVSLPPALSLSSSVSITSVTPETTMTSILNKPSVTIHPTTSSADTQDIEKDSGEMENSVDILAISRAHENGGDKPVKKRHMITSSSVDGRLITTIKAATGALDSSELSDSESEDESTSLSSIDDETMNHLPSPWLKRDTPDSSSVYRESPPTKKRKMITDEVSLRVPLMYGWRRETTMRTITQSGVRGEVIYYAPCGKPFRQYPDIMRYLEKNGITEVTRDNFSFSSKIPIGDYIDANTQKRHSEGEVRDSIQQIREQKGYKPMRKNEDGRDALEIEAEAILRRLEAEEEAEKARKEFITQLEEQQQLSWPADLFGLTQQDVRDGIQREQERVKKQEELRREKEDLRKQREEENRQRLYEQLRKAQEREQEKQKQKLLKEQLYLQELNKQREMLYTLELERERRRYHGVLVRALESRKRYEERERRREEMKEEKRANRERKREERLQARELNQLMKEVKEDMELTDHIPLPDAPRLEGLRLPPEAFGNILMVFEFLHNFGETLGFDMESLPSIQSLQMALLNDSESEEELLSVLSHLLVCAIEDPGIPSSQRHTTILGQTLNRADITHANISEILRVYLNANATGEVRVIHGLLGTEKERRENPKKAQDWDSKLAEMDAYKMSQWLMQLPFLALNPTQKSEIVAYVCNELLQNKAVVRQIEDSLDRHNGLKTEKWKLDARIRKLRMSVARKRIYNAAMRSMMEHRGEDSNMSSVSAISSCLGEQDKVEKKDKEDDKLKEEEEEEEEDENESGNDSDAMEEIPDEVKEDDKHLSADDASKTLDLLQRQMNQVRQDLFETAQQVRGFNCGQDRYQRTMWVLPHAGGPFLEGLTSCDYTGRDHFPISVPPSAAKVGYSIEEVNAKLQEARAIKDKQIKEERKAKREIKEEPFVKEEKMDTDIVKTEAEVKIEKKDDNFIESDDKESIDMKPLNGQVKEEDSEVPDIPQRTEKNKEEIKKKEDIKNSDSQNGLSESKANGNTNSDVYSSLINAGLNPFMINGLKEGNNSNSNEGIDQNLLATGLGLVPGQYLRTEHVAQREKLSFSLLPRIPCDVSSLEALPTGQTPQGTPRGSPREASPFSRFSGPQSPVSGVPQVSCNTPGPVSTPGTVDTPGAFSTPGMLSTPGVLSTPGMMSTPGSINTPVGLNTPVTANSTPGMVNSLPGTMSTSEFGSTPGVLNTPGSVQSLPHKELLERLHQTAEALPIPEEYKMGWWHLGDFEQLREMINALNERGVRERELKRFIEKNFTIVKNALSKIDSEAVTLDPEAEDGEKVVYDEHGTPVADEPSHWLPDIALKVDFLILDTVYAMEEKITNASMQNKSWRLGDSGDKHVGEFRASCLQPVDENDTRLNPIHVGRDRLLALEEGIERRYLKPPLGVPPNPKNEGCTQETKESPKGLQIWREAVSKSETAAQLAMCTYMLETAVAWDKSIMKAETSSDSLFSSGQYCQFCHSGDHEEKLLLCDGCDKGYHTHCFKPPMNNIPDGDWYCYECVNKFSDTSQRHCLVCGGTEGRTLVHCSICPRAYHTACITPNLAKVPRNKWVCPACTSKSPRGRRGRAKKVSESNNSSVSANTNASTDATADVLEDSQGVISPATTSKKERANKKKEQKDLIACKSIISELEVHEDAWPFLLPVNTRQFPTYKKIIKKPMDLSAIKKKLDDNTYKTREEYCDDLRLMFNNCETFNEDDSPVGKAGHNLRSFFETKWNENFPPT